MMTAVQIHQLAYRQMVCPMYSASTVSMDASITIIHGLLCRFFDKPLTGRCGKHPNPVN